MNVPVASLAKPLVYQLSVAASAPAPSGAAGVQDQHCHQPQDSADTGMQHTEFDTNLQTGASYLL